ncbi:hypothetical protein JTB14_017506 [Gonioctena quinquepunctata]|nr:hypothetical protein JTB14_017506 [Gonioctena quinquepunctata]
MSHIHILEEMEVTLQYLSEENRRKTFKKWVFGAKEACNADKMAEAGFIFTGNKHEPDSAKCFFCNKALDGWDSTDDPWKEHLKHAPKCNFAKLQKQQDSITLEKFLNLRCELLRSVVDSCIDKVVDEAEQVADNCETFRLKVLKKK